MTDRYEISAQSWAMIEAIISPPQRMGRPRCDDCQMLNGVLWILCSGAKWRDLPERFAPWKTVYSGSGNGLITARSTRSYAIYIYVCAKMVLLTWIPGWSTPTQFEPLEQPVVLEKKGSAGTATLLSGPQPRRIDHQNTPCLR